LIEQKSVASLSTLTEFLPEYQNSNLNVKTFNECLSKMMALNVNIEPILRSECAWDVIN